MKITNKSRRLDKHRSNRRNSISFSCEFHRVTERRDTSLWFRPVRFNARIDRAFRASCNSLILPAMFFFFFFFNWNHASPASKETLFRSRTEHLRNSCWPVVSRTVGHQLARLATWRNARRKSSISPRTTLQTRSRKNRSHSLFPPRDPIPSFLSGYVPLYISAVELFEK